MEKLDIFMDFTKMRAVFTVFKVKIAWKWVWKKRAVI